MRCKEYGRRGHGRCGAAVGHGDHVFFDDPVSRETQCGTLDTVQQRADMQQRRDDTCCSLLLLQSPAGKNMKQNPESLRDILSTTASHRYRSDLLNDISQIAPSAFFCDSSTLHLKKAWSRRTENDQLKFLGVSFQRHDTPLHPSTTRPTALTTQQHAPYSIHAISCVRTCARDASGSGTATCDPKAAPSSLRCSSEHTCCSSGRHALVCLLLQPTSCHQHEVQAMTSVKELHRNRRKPCWINN